MSFDRLDLAQARLYLRGMIKCEKWDTSGGLYGVDDLIGGGVAYLVSDAGGPLAVVVIQQLEHEYGRELVIRVGRQLASCGDLTERVLPELEEYFGAGCKHVTIYTKRPGLVCKLERAGYREAARIMRKTLR